MNRIFMVLIATFLGFVATAGHAQETLKNGFYLILEEQADPAKLQKPAEDEVIVTSREFQQFTAANIDRALWLKDSFAR